MVRKLCEIVIFCNKKFINLKFQGSQKFLSFVFRYFVDILKKEIINSFFCNQSFNVGHQEKTNIVYFNKCPMTLYSKPTLESIEAWTILSQDMVATLASTAAWSGTIKGIYQNECV